ncbi:MAG: hypothetical protein AB7I18_10795 [Candidatus Berkiella sp.]
MSTWLVCAHDSGGAELVSAWAKKSQESCLFMVSGPALAIFEQKLANFHNNAYGSLDRLLNEVDTVLLGTSGHSDFERQILRRAKERGIKTISFLDHWVNYEMRFNLNGKLILPDEIWVSDEIAFNFASKHFRDTPIKLVTNDYFNEITERAQSYTQLQRDPNRIRILYCSQPTILDYGYDEYCALTNYLNYLSTLDNKTYEIRIRLHPAETPNKFQKIIDEFQSVDRQIYAAKPADIVEDCLWADWVVGCETMAMVVALRLSRTVFSNIPKGGKPISLPFPEIISLFN